jgi:UDP-N-acetylglucosamine pyrophosphorylase
MEYMEKLKKYNQEHLLKYLNLCDDEKKKALISQIESIDFENLNELYKISKSNNNQKIDVNEIHHLSYVDKYNMDESFKNELKNIGEEVIKNNQYAVVTMAGGQGTRLGHTGPKGTFLLNVSPKPKYLFEILADSLKSYNEKYKIVLNWYIMTSHENNDETVDFFEKHNYFDYPKENIKFFKQGNMPLLSEDGKLIVDENYNIKMAADGNGCIYKSMKIDGILSDMKSKNIKWVFIGAVDNAILNMADEVLLGLTIYQKNEIASKSIVKAGPSEKVGVFCKRNNKPCVIEYSEMPEGLAELRDENGELLYGESHVMCNLFSIKALEKIANEKLPYHSAHKKANFLDENGKQVIATEPNVYKYEAFIFDAFKYFDDITILRGKREEDFAPIKNKEGVDSPETAIKLYNDLHSNY